MLSINTDTVTQLQKAVEDQLQNVLTYRRTPKKLSATRTRDPDEAAPAPCTNAHHMLMSNVASALYTSVLKAVVCRLCP